MYPIDHPIRFHALGCYSSLDGRRNETTLFIFFIPVRETARVIGTFVAAVVKRKLEVGSVFFGDGVVGGVVPSIARREDVWKNETMEHVVV